jgi:hypothetical protein
VRVVDPEAPGLGVPRSSCVGMARRDRHTSFVWAVRRTARSGRGTADFGSPHVRNTSRRHHRRGEGRGATSKFPQPFWGEDRQPERSGRRTILWCGPDRTVAVTDSLMKGLILAQNERWRRGLGMQVERARFSDRASGARVSKATVTNPMVGHSRGKLRVIPSEVRVGHPVRTKAPAPWDGLSWY